LKVDADGAAIPSIGRFMRLTLIRQDRSNWVVLGELEVFGRGYGSGGEIRGEFAGPEPVNIGRIRWQAEIPSQTRVRMQFRGLAVDEAGPEWEELPLYEVPGGSFSGVEPVVRFHYRALLESAAPFATPALRAIEVDYDPVLVAREVLGSVEADAVGIGERTTLKYRAVLQVEPDDYGIDFISLEGAPVEVEEIRFEEAMASFEEVLDPEGGTIIVLDPADRIEASGALEIAGRALFLQDQTALVLRVGSRVQQERDGYINWQNAREDPASTWTVRAGGALGLLSKVEFGPRPFSPLGAELEFRFVVGHLRDQTEVAVRIFTIEGRRVRKLALAGGTGEYRMAWDGRDQQNRIVAPGLYLFEVRVEAGDSTSSRRGAFVVAY
jgi:hypothetical protein